MSRHLACSLHPAILPQGVNRESGEAMMAPQTRREFAQSCAAAVALGKLGGLKGGKARAEKLTAKKRKEIAKKAAKKRWEE